MKKALFTTVLTTSLLASSLFATLAASNVQAANYKVDIEGAHAFVQFKIKHLGYSWLLGRFNTFDGGFTYDDKSPNNAKINIEIDTASLDSNHAERDKHLKGKDLRSSDSGRGDMNPCQQRYSNGAFCYTSSLVISH